MRIAVAIAVTLAFLGAADASDNPSADFQKADKELNETFKQIERRLADDAASKERLVHAQRAWIAFRDAECIFQSSGEDGGSVAPTIIALCQAGMTSDRTEQLKVYLNCEEGDMSCPVPAN